MMNRINKTKTDGAPNKYRFRPTVLIQELAPKKLGQYTPVTSCHIPSASSNAIAQPAMIIPTLAMIPTTVIFFSLCFMAL